MITTKVKEHAAVAADAGFKAAAAHAVEMAVRATKLARAYEHFRYVSQDVINQFNKRLLEQTMKREGHGAYCYDSLKFTAVENYTAMPPRDVLDAVAAARGMGIFDAYEVAQIESVVVVPDPIVFGRVEGCSDRFYIAQWGDDVKITDLIGANEG